MATTATTLARLAELVAGRLVGDGSVVIQGAAALGDAVSGQITLVDGPERLERLTRSDAAAAVVPAGAVPSTMPVVVVDEPHHAFKAIIEYFHPRRPRRRCGVSPQAIVSPSARLGEDVDVHPLVTIGDDVEIGPHSTVHSGVHIMAGCRIGAGVTIMPGAVLYEDTVVGPDSLVHAGAVIGAHGFGYETVGGRHVPCAQLGHVEIGADVEIGANTTIDRGTYGPTTIGEGTKIDNLVMIAHNCRIGRHNIICSQVGIAGSTTTGDYVMLAGQVGVRDHVRIGHHAGVGAKAGVSNDVADGTFVLGIPAVPEREQKLKFAAISKLPEMRKEFRALKRTVEELLEERNAADGNPPPSPSLHARAS